MIVYPFSFFQNPSGGGYADATAYLAAVVATGGTVTSDITAAVNTLFEDLKTAGIYSKLDLLMPMVGGTKPSILINAKEPTNSLWGWTEFGTSLTYNVSGITGNNSGVLRSNFMVSAFTQCITGSSHFGIYYNKLATSGTYLSGFINTQQIPYGYFNVANYSNALYGGQFGGSAVFNVSDTPALGWWYAQRTAINNASWYRDNTLIQNPTDTVEYLANDPNRPIALFTLAWIGQGPNNLYEGEIGNQSMCTVTIGGSLNSTERTDLYDIITAFNTALSRN